MAQKSKILRHLNIEQGVSNISNATISDLPVNLFLFVAVFQNGELYMQRIFWTISLAWEIWCYYFRLLFIPLAFRKHEKVCNILNITLVLDLSTKNQIDFKKKKNSRKTKSISNWTRAARSFDFEITRMISDQIALHSVRLPLWKSLHSIKSLLVGTSSE